MLYVTTRNNRDVSTPHRVLRKDRDEDGGLYIPFRLPHLTREDVEKIAEKPFHAIVADVLNLLFNTRITPWDVEFAIGRFPVKLISLHQKILIGECWHNPFWDFSHMADCLSGLLQGEDKKTEFYANWTGVAVRISVLCGICGELLKNGTISFEKPLDVSVPSGDFDAPAAVWYAREMGLPVGTIVCCCNENSAIWELFRFGNLKTDMIAEKTALPLADVVVPSGLERLISAAAGSREVLRYLDCCRTGRNYRMEENNLKRMRRGIYVTVSSQSRIQMTLANIFKSERRILSPYAALAYAGLQDYRAGTGALGTGLVLSERSPISDCRLVSQILQIPETDIAAYL